MSQPRPLPTTSRRHHNNLSILSTSAPDDDDEATIQRRIRQLRQEQAALQGQLRVQKFAHAYKTQFAFPAVVTWRGSTCRTDPTLIQHRLLEAGMMYEVPVTIGETARVLNTFVQDLEATGCFRAVQVELGGEPPVPPTTESADEQPQHQQQVSSQRVTVVLDESKWYNLYLGGGLKQSSLLGTGATTDQSFLPTAEFEAKLGLRNLSGCLDHTQLQYSLDTHHIATWWLQHDRPLYSVMPTGVLQNWILEQPNGGSQYWFRSKLMLDTQDHQMTRSYQEYQRLLSLGMYTSRHVGTNAAVAAMAEGKLPSTPQQSSLKSLSLSFQAGLEWNLLFRDLIPRRHATLPYQYAASPQVVSQAGPSVKHSVVATVFGAVGGSGVVAATDASMVDDAMLSTTTQDGDDVENENRLRTPVHPLLDYKLQTEVAFPPGDVGFFKTQADVGLHVPLLRSQSLSLHVLGSIGILKSLKFGGLTRSAALSDRFLLGGPLQFRGFSPAGIGPRTAPPPGMKATTTPGDALGGDLLYKLTGVLSAPVALPALQSAGVSMFAFGQVGTCAHCISPLLRNELSIVDVLSSSRASAGVGLATNLFGPRLELTYAIPLRYGPMDHRRTFQVGMGFSMGG